MKFPYSMLLDYVSTRLTAVEVGDLLTMAGFELEAIEPVGDEWVLDVKVMSNRGDGLSVFGLAREVLAKDPSALATPLYQQASARFPMPDDRDEGETGCLASVAIETTDCTRYACRLFRNVPTAPAPSWIQERLTLSGQRPISLLVDLTNYVMLELGQPLHAFDLDKVAGAKIVVRHARPGEKLTLLDGDKHELQPGQMMICDAERPVAAAGIMGGLDTEVTGGTQNVLLESAHFANNSVRKTRNQLGLSTEASYRFERSVDPEGVVAALNRFAGLLAEVDGGGSLVQGVIDSYPRKPAARTLKVRLSRATRLLGMPVAADEARSYLERLGMEVSGDGEPFTVVPPSWRADLVREDDLIEDIGRVHGYERIPEAFPIGSTPQGGVVGSLAVVDHVREAALRAGFDQIISHSLRDAHPLDQPGAPRVGPRNPTSPETALLRSSLLSCLADAAKRNGSKDLHLFETGRVFAPVETRKMAFLSQGALEPPHWVKGTLLTADFFSLKGTVEEALASAHVAAGWGSSTDPRFHPTRQASVQGGDAVVGVLGQIHPDVASACDLPEDTILAELDLEAVLACRTTSAKMRSVSRNPAVRRDIALLMAKSVPYAAIERAIGEAGGDVLERQWLFDVYEGAGIPEGFHSLAIALQLRKMGGNFTDEEANQVRDRIVAALAALGGTTR